MSNPSFFKTYSIIMPFTHVLLFILHVAILAMQAWHISWKMSGKIKVKMMGARSRLKIQVFHFISQ